MSEGGTLKVNLLLAFQKVFCFTDFLNCHKKMRSKAVATQENLQYVSLSSSALSNIQAFNLPCPFVMFLESYRDCN